MFWERAITVVAAIGLALCAAQLASAATITVCPADCDFADIQSAIDASINGDVIEIAAGTYAPPATLTTNGKAITLRGATNADGTPATVIDGLGDKQVLLIEAGEGATTVIENLVVTGGFANSGGGIRLTQCSPIIANCTLVNNTASDFGGGLYMIGGSPTINQCTITQNTTLPNNGRGGGIYCHASSPTLLHCMISANQSSASGGGVGLSGSPAVMSACTIKGNSAIYGGGLSVGASSPTLTNCVIGENTATGTSGRGGGMFIFSNAHPMLVGSVFCGNTAAIGPQYELLGGSLEGSDTCFAHSCTDADGDGWPDQCSTVGDGVHEVPGEYATIEAAVAAAGTGDVVLLAPGTYTLGATLNPYGKAITIRGATNADGAPASIIDGQGLRRVIIMEGGEGPASVLENLVITGGWAPKGGGIYLVWASPTMRNCTIMDNYAAGDGGGVYSVDGSATLLNCSIRENSTGSGGDGGGVFFSRGAPTLTNCAINDNSSDTGGGMYFYLSAATLTGCAINDNAAGWGGGAYSNGAPITLEGCEVAGNSATAYGGGLALVGGSSVLTDCTIRGNSATYSGGGIHSEYGTRIITSCAIADNTVSSATGKGGGAYLYATPFTVEESYFCGNSATYSAQLYRTVATFAGDGNCFAMQCTDADNDGLPDECASVGDGIHEVPSEYATIEAAVLAAGMGDVVVVGSGKYTLAAPLNLLGKAITIRGSTNADGTPATTISGEGVRSVIYMDNSEGPQTLLENLIIADGFASQGGGMYLVSSSPSLLNCAFVGNSATSGGAAYLSSSAAALTNCVFTGNSATGGGGLLVSQGSPTLTNCTVSGNASTGAGGGGVRLDQTSATLLSCSITDNTSSWQGGGIFSYYGSPTLTGCTISSNTADMNGGGVAVYVGSPKLDNCTLGENIAGAYGGGIWSSSASPTLNQSVLCSNSAPIGEQVYLVNGALSGQGNCFAISCTDSDGDGTVDECGVVGDGVHEVPGEFATIEAAVLAAGNGEVISIGAGTFTPGATLDTLGKMLTIRGTVNADGTLATVIDGQGLRRAFKVANGEGPGMVFDNLIITRGRADYGGGMYVHSASPTVTNCVFTGNTAFSHGGAIYLSASQSTLANCTITANSSATSGGGLRVVSGGPTVTNCNFSGNSTGAFGGAAYAEDSLPKFTGCTFSGNHVAARGGAMYLVDSPAVLTNCNLGGNSATGSDGLGGGIYVASSSPKITGCTLSGNTAGTIGGGLYTLSSPIVAATVVCGNSAPSSAQVYGATTSWQACCVSSDCGACDDSTGDLNFDGRIDGTDVAYLLGAWGMPNPPIGDLTGDGIVDATDLAALLSHWGPVP